LPVDAKWSNRLATVALLGLLLSAAVHMLTLFGVNAASHSKAVYVLHLGLFLVFIPFMIDVRRFRKGGWPQLTAAIPAWAYFAVVAVGVYAAMNFRLAMGPNSGRVMAASDVHGLRAFSGDWLLFYSIPTVYFRWAPRVIGASGGRAA